MKKLMTTAMISGLVLVLAACNTVAGAGRDVKSAGTAIEKSAD